MRAENRSIGIFFIGYLFCWSKSLENERHCKWC